MSPESSSHPRLRSSHFWVTRTRSLEELRASLVSDVTLIRGPAGSGKTVLVRQLLARLRREHASSAAYVEYGSGPERLVAASQALAAIEHAESTVLIVDGLRGDARYHQALTDALDRDPRLSIVVTTRHATLLEDPFMALDYDLQFTSPELLLFTDDETAGVLDRNSVEWSAGAVRTLNSEISGWPALAQLAGTQLRMNGRPLTTASQARMIGQEVRLSFVSHLVESGGLQPADELRLLALAPRFDPEVIEMLAPRADSTPGLLERLRDAGATWPPGRGGARLAEPVRAQWRHEVESASPTRADAVRLSLVQLYARRSAPREALDAARSLRDEAQRADAMARVVDDIGASLWRADRDLFAAAVRELAERPTSSPVVTAVVLAHDNDVGVVSRAAVLAGAALAAQQDQSDRAARNAPGDQVARDGVRLRLLRLAGRFDEAVTHTRQRTTAESEPPAGSSTDQTARAAASASDERTYQIALTLFASDDALRARSELEASALPTRSATRIRAQGLLALAHLVAGDVHAASDQIDRAEGTSTDWEGSPWGEPFELARWWLRIEAGVSDPQRQRSADESSIEYWPIAAYIGALSQLRAGSAHIALDTLRAYTQRFRGTALSPLGRSLVAAARTVTMLELREAPRLVHELSSTSATGTSAVHRSVLPRLFAGDAAEVQRLVRPIGRWRAPTPRAETERLVVHALASVMEGDDETARASASSAVTLSERFGVWTPWDVVPPTLHQRLRDMLPPPMAQRLAQRKPLINDGRVVPRLTDRELELLRALRDQRTTTDIARSLAVSPNTLKSRLRQLYRRLGVADRAEALRIAGGWLVD